MLFVLVCALHEPNFPSPYPPAWVASCLEKITLKNCTELKLELRVTLWKINIGSEREREREEHIKTSPLFSLPSFPHSPFSLWGFCHFPLTFRSPQVLTCHCNVDRLRHHFKGGKQNCRPVCLSVCPAFAQNSGLFETLKVGLQLQAHL